MDLNVSVGGMNPSAVEHMAATTGDYGRLVWMSTFDSEAQVRYSKQDRPFVRVSQNGQLLPETRQVIALIARRNLVLATGHPTAEEALMMIREGRAQGVKHMVVTHAMMQPIHMSDAQMLEAAKMGAYIEFVYNGLIGSYKEFTFKDYARAIRYVGVEHCILASDMGQPANPVHPDGLVLFFNGLKEQGFSQAEIDRMAKENPARLLGLEYEVPTRKVERLNGEYGSKGFLAQRCRRSGRRLHAGCSAGRGQHEGEDDWDPGRSGLLL